MAHQENGFHIDVPQGKKDDCLTYLLVWTTGFMSTPEHWPEDGAQDFQMGNSDYTSPILE